MASARCGVRARVVFDGHASKSGAVYRTWAATSLFHCKTKRPDAGVTGYGHTRVNTDKANKSNYHGQEPYRRPFHR